MGQDRRLPVRGAVPRRADPPSRSRLDAGVQRDRRHRRVFEGGAPRVLDPPPEIEMHLEKHGETSARAAQVAAYATRKAKDVETRRRKPAAGMHEHAKSLGLDEHTLAADVDRCIVTAPASRDRDRRAAVRRSSPIRLGSLPAQRASAARGPPSHQRSTAQRWGYRTDSRARRRVPHLPIVSFRSTRRGCARAT